MVLNGMVQLISQANDAATTLQAALRGHTTRRLLRSGEMLHSVEDYQVTSPKAIAANLMAQQALEVAHRYDAPATPAKAPTGQQPHAEAGDDAGSS